MSITEKSLKLLWANAAGLCSFAACDEKLTVRQAGSVAPHTLGEMAHIKGRGNGSNRYDENQTDEQRNSYENLILLCPNHHTLIDKPENEEIYSVEILLKMKFDHENKVNNKLQVEKLSDIDKVKYEISMYLAENKETWLQYGPVSETAKKNPHSDEIYAVWKSERLSTIVPNNRLIVKILKKYKSLFSKDAQKTVSMFLLHAFSYEKWVNDEIPYQAVMRFPVEFECLIMES